MLLKRVIIMDNNTIIKYNARILRYDIHVDAHNIKLVIFLLAFNFLLLGILC
ncbi:hypothetical protein IMSAGC011_02140 [Lachnospiraceae bacterium]|nr:hypothetical protein IMSAGC011_02140 [Lachnospiraceae bacterium]